MSSTNSREVLKFAVVCSLIVLMNAACDNETEQFHSQELMERDYSDLDGVALSVYANTISGDVIAEVVLQEGMAFWDGDIILGTIDELLVVDDGRYYRGEEYADYLLGFGEMPNALEITPSEFLKAGAGVGNINRVWPANGNRIEIDYKVKTTCSGSHQYELSAAIRSWEDATDGYLYFDEYTGTWGGNSTDPRIVFGCDVNTCASAKVGMKANGPQSVYIKDCVDDDGNPDHEVIIHEIGHAIGLFHEHQRLSRDDDIIYHSENVKNGWNGTGQFLHCDDPGKYGLLGCHDVGRFDYDSIMLYSSCSKVKYESDVCQDYFNCTKVKTISECEDEFEDYTGPSWAIKYGNSSPYDYTEVLQSTNDTLINTGYTAAVNRERSNDLYTIGRLYADAWYVSEDAKDPLTVLNWHPQDGTQIDTEDLRVGHFCDDELGYRPDGDDIMWIDHTASPDEWFVVCDGGYPYWHYDQTGAAEETKKSLLTKDIQGIGSVGIGDFNGVSQPDLEKFDDFLINNPAPGDDKWVLYEDGELGGWYTGTWNDLEDDIATLGFGSFCYPYEGTTDAVRQEPDGDYLQISCSAATDWIDLEVQQNVPLLLEETPHELQFADINNDSFDEVIRNNPLTGRLQIAFSDDTNASSNSPVFYPAGFETVTLIANPALPASPTVGDDMSVSDLSFGDFRSTTSCSHDGKDIFYHHNGVELYWFVAASESLNDTNGPKLYWQLLNDFHDWDEYFVQNQGVPEPQPVLVGKFTTPDDQVCADMSDIMMPQRRITD